MQRPTYAENNPFGGKVLIKGEQLINIATIITLGKCLNVRVRKHAIDLYLMKKSDTQSQEHYFLMKMYSAISSYL